MTKPIEELTINKEQMLSAILKDVSFAADHLNNVITLGPNLDEKRFIELRAVSRAMKKMVSSARSIYGLHEQVPEPGSVWDQRDEFLSHLSDSKEWYQRYIVPAKKR